MRGMATVRWFPVTAAIFVVLPSKQLLRTLAAARARHQLDYPELSMPGPDKSAFTETNLGSSGPRDRAAEVYDRHAVAVYRQALLMLADEDMAGQVACDVITGECARAAAAPGDQDSASRRLAMSVLRRCQELLDSRARQDRAGRRRPARRDAGRHSLRGSERALLGLVLFGRPGLP